MLVDEGPPEAAWPPAAPARRSRTLASWCSRILSGTTSAAPPRARGEPGAVSSSTRASLRPIPRSGPRSRRRRERRVPVVTARPGSSTRSVGSGSACSGRTAPGLPARIRTTDAVVLLVSYGQTDVLLAADAESDVLLPLRLPPVEILKVSHHGSADACLPSLLEDLRPRIAVISVGAGNTYGHPTPETLAALGRAGPGRLPDGRDGAVTDRVGRASTSRVATEH